jgi:glycosyltransferase involved in cell wall biosynthesis
MKKLIYIANIRLPTEKAHGIQIMEMCNAFARSGTEVELVVPRRLNPIKGDPFVYYDVKKSFSTKKLPCIDFVKFGRIGYWIQSLSFVKFASWYSLFRKDSLFYTRDEIVALFLRLIVKKIVWEGHGGEKNFLVKSLIKRKVSMVMITKGLKDLYVSMGADPEKIIVSPDAVDVEQFSINLSKEEARKKLDLPTDKKIVLYAGHLYSWKGADTAVQSASGLPDNVIIIFVGGTAVDIERFEKNYGQNKKVMILGKKPHEEMPLYMKSADILLLPNSAKEDISKLYTSPMKLFEYMASGNPIIASDLPSLKEILNESNAYFFEPDNSESLAGAIKKVLANYDEACSKAKIALELVQNFSWQKRALSILDFIND